MLRFQYGFKKVLRLNQISAVKVETITDTKEAELPTIYMIPDGTVDLDKWYYHGVYVLLKFKNVVVLV